MTLFTKLDCLAAKIETTYGTDSVPVGSTDAMLVRNMSITPMDQTRVPRDLQRPFLGASEELPAQILARVEFEVELAGAGAAGTVPGYGPLLRACGLQQTVSAGVSVAYAPRSTAFESVTLYAFSGNAMRHIITGARGSVVISLPNQGIPVMRFTMMGRYAAPTDNALTGAVYTAFQRPVVCNATNTTPFTVQGYSPMAASVEIDLGNVMAWRDMIGGTQQALITDRNVTGTLSLEKKAIAVWNPWAALVGATTGAFSLQHGQTAGNRVDLAGPACQLMDPRESESDNIRMWSLGMRFVPSAGNDEFTITVR